MIQEYLFVGNEHRDEIEKYTYKNVKKELYDIEDSECWIATFSLSEENENNAKVLSEVHEYVKNHFNPVVLSNGCSAYYNKALYPYFNEFEYKLRKLLYLKSALSKSMKDFEVISNLEEKDLGEIFSLLFSDTQFVQEVKKSVNGKSWQFTKAEILMALQEISENTLWDKLIDENAAPLLRSEFVRVKKFRNDVMHAHNMNASSFSDALTLIKKVNEQFDEEIGKIITAKETNPTIQEANDFNTAMSDALKDMDKRRKLIEQFDEMRVSGFSRDFPEKYGELTLPLFEDDNYRKYLQEIGDSEEQLRISKILGAQIDVSPALKEIQKAAESIEEYNTYLIPAVVELQKTLQAIEINPDFAELAAKIKGYKGGDSDEQDEI